MLLLIDGNNLAHRARHVFSLSNKGVDVSVTYGVIRIISSLISKYDPTSVMVCFDGGTPEFRKRFVPEYKANRHKDEDPMAWEDFNRQMNELSDYALPLMGMAVARKLGAEADDLLYHASRMYNGNSLIVTNDKDLLQAVSEKTSVLNPSKEVIVTLDNFEEVTGISKNLYVDWRAIQGDGSDNIPGVPGIGEKTATKLFKEFGSLSNIINATLGHHPTLKLEGKLGANIASFGIDRIAKNVYVTALYADRVGAKQAVLDAVYNYKQADKDRVKKYLMRNGFVSLMEGKFYRSIMKLEVPEFDHTNIRIPVVINRRIALV